MYLIVLESTQLLAQHNILDRGYGRISEFHCYVVMMEMEGNGPVRLVCNLVCNIIGGMLVDLIIAFRLCYCSFLHGQTSSEQ